MIFDELRTKRLYLRKFEDNDIQFVYEHFSNANVIEHIIDKEPPANIDEAKDILKWCMELNSENHIRWCITTKDKLKQIGTCGFHNYDKKNNAAEIGYDLSFTYWKKGYMFEALTKMLTFGLENLGLNRIYAYVYISNVRSNMLLEKLGFKLEGVIRDKRHKPVF